MSAKGTGHQQQQVQANVPRSSANQIHVLQNGNLERDARSLSWLMVGQLVAVTICDGYEPRFREDYDESDTTNTETEF